MEFEDYEALPSTTSLPGHMIAGACAGIVEHVVMFPIDSVKTRMQCIRPINAGNYSNVISGLHRLILHEGIVGSLKGSGALIFGAGPAHAVYFGCYEQLKTHMASVSSYPAHLNHMIAGATATVLHDSIMTPADTVKQRLQIFNSPYRNSFDCLKRILSNEGLSVLYRAYFTQLFMNIPYQTIHFVSYEYTQTVFNPSKLYLPWTHVLSGAIAGSLAAVCTNPLDVCKTLLNTQESCMLQGPSHDHKANKPQIRGLMKSISIIYQLEGLRGFTRGLQARMLTATPGTALSWSVYEYFKWRLGQNDHNFKSLAGDNTIASSELPTRNDTCRPNVKWFSSSESSGCSPIPSVRPSLQPDVR